MRTLLVFASALGLAACSSTPDGPVAEAGALENGDATLTSGEYADRFTVRMNEGQWLRVTLDSDAFDTYLVVRAPSGQQSDLDDSTPGDTTTVTMTLRAQESGQFEIIATSYRPGATGDYRMTYEVTDAEPAGGATAAPTDAVRDGTPRGDADSGARDDAAAPQGDAPSVGGRGRLVPERNGDAPHGDDAPRGDEVKGGGADADGTMDA